MSRVIADGLSVKAQADLNLSDELFTNALKNKLDAIEANATTDQTNSEIKSAYEANADTNEFSDAEETKLSNIEANAEVNVGTDVGVVYNASSISVTSTTGTNATVNGATQTEAGVLSSSDKSKLDAIEANATADQTNSEIKIAYEANADTNEFSDSEQTSFLTLKVVLLIMTQTHS